LEALKLKYQNYNIPPYLSFKTIIFKETKKNVTEKITIYNQGYPINDFEEITKTFIVATSYNKNNKKEITIPIIYYGITSSSSGGKGELSTLIDPGNFQYYIDLYNASLNYKGNKAVSDISMKLVNVTKIDYLDPIDGEKSAYFINNKPSDKEKADIIFSKAIPVTAYDIQEITVSDIVKLFLTY
jgi:hypothetical protein